MEETELPAERPPEGAPEEDESEAGEPAPDSGADEVPGSADEDVQGDDELGVEHADA